MSYGSYQNLIAGSNPVYMPKIGDGATEISWTDRAPYTIVEVVSPRQIVVQADNATRDDANGMSDCQNYVFSPNPNGSKMTVTLRGNGKWIVKGESAKNGRKFVVGSRGKYHDFSF